VSFASDPGRDDGSLPPVNIVVPDDARELERDVLAYRRELRAKRRRRRFTRLLRPFRTEELGGHAAIIPLIAACLAISLVGGALLSVITMSPAHAPTTSDQPPGTGTLTRLPPGAVLLRGKTGLLAGKAVPVQSLKSSAIALVPANCGCGPELKRLADQARAAGAGLYFAGTGDAIPQLPALTARYGERTAVEADDRADVLGAVYHPSGLTVLFVFKDATADVHRIVSADFELGPELEKLKQTGSSATGQPTSL
jgi:hypothetical protein